MFEVEAKVPLSPAKYKEVKSYLDNKAKFSKNSHSQDTYYDETAMKAVVRIRKRDKKDSFDLKWHDTKKGIESNIEIEWGIKDLPGWKSFLKKLDINPFMRKEKKSLFYQLEDYSIELNHVTKLGYYLEIEKLVDSENEIIKAKKGLIEVFEKFGFSAKDFEPKRYLELLKNV
jgi:adenylate cyclase class 2